MTDVLALAWPIAALVGLLAACATVLIIFHWKTVRIPVEKYEDLAAKVKANQDEILAVERKLVEIIGQLKSITAKQQLSTPTHRLG